MAEQAAPAPGEAADSEQDVLLATKLHVPGTRPGFVPRPRLADRLEEGLDRKLVLVSAPAGSGKTALLADWARHNRRPVAWLSLDPGDNDPARFWRHATAALDQVRPGIAGQVAALLGPPAPRSFRGVVTAVINEIAAQPADEEILLFLDDYNLKSHAIATLAMADWLRGRLPEAEQGFASSITAWREAGRPALALAAWGYRSLGQVQRAQGRLGAALQTYQQAADITADFRQAAAPTAGTGNVGLAEIAYARGDLDTALRHVTESISRNRELVYTPLLAIGLALLAWIRQAEGNPAGARDSMGEAARLAPDPAITSLLNPVPADQARLLLAQGDVVAARRWVRERGLGADDELAYPREAEYLVLARVLVAESLPGRALALLERMHAAAAGQGRAGCVIETRALQALALAANGEEGRALSALAEALTLGYPEGYVRVFADEGEPMRALLGRLASGQRTQHSAARGIPAGYLARIRRAFDLRPAEPQTATAAAPGLPDPLTSRERQVLALLAQGRSNRDIAAELVVTLDTVKRHVSHILAKLGAVNRTEAVARARELNLIP